VASPFDIETSVRRARHRLDSGDALRAGPRRKKRSDNGKSRIHPPVLRHLRALLASQDFPGIAPLLAALQRFCLAEAVACPSRATVYKLMQRDPAGTYPVTSLPPSVRAALYNLSDDAVVPGAQLAFYCFNYGDLAATHFAAGLPWLPLYQAYRMRGWRRQSQGLLRAVLVARKVPHVPSAL